jgi:hypothetical protein
LLPTITTTTYPKDRPAGWPPAYPLTQNIRYPLSHTHPKARLDIGCRLWQLNTGCVDSLSYERCRHNGPRSRSRPRSPLLHLPQ